MNIITRERVQYKERDLQRSLGGGGGDHFGIK